MRRRSKREFDVTVPANRQSDQRLRVASQDSGALAEHISKRAHLLDELLSDAGAAATEHERIVAARVRHLVPADQPLVLITQAPRSGGTLLLRLLDSQPQCHVFPHEMEGLLTDKDAMAGELRERWSQSFERLMARLLARGQRQGKSRLNQDLKHYPLLIPPVVQRRIFQALLADVEARSEREVLDRFVTAYFNAWLDNRNLHVPQEKSWVVGFAPGVIANPAAMRRFENAYPDGRLVSEIGRAYV